MRFLAFLSLVLSILIISEAETVLRPNLYFGTRSQSKDSHLVLLTLFLFPVVWYYVV